MTSLIEGYRARYSSAQEEELSLEEYLQLCRKDPDTYASAAERMLRAIGEPELVDTRLDQRLSRIFSNRLIKQNSSLHHLAHESFELILHGTLPSETRGSA